MRFFFYAFVLMALFAFGFGATTASAFDSRVPYLETLKEETRIKPSDEIRALWVVRDALVSKGKIDRLVAFAARGRFHLLFAQVRGRGDAYYESRFEPPATDLEVPLTEFDPLEYLLIRAREEGLSVHAWVNVFYVWSNPAADPPPGHVVRRFPEWLVADPEGARMDSREVDAWSGQDAEGYFLSPENPEVRNHTVRVIEDIVTRYAVDGVHLDYIRYPARLFGYELEARRDFALYWGVDPLEFVRWREQTNNAVDEGNAILDSLITERRVQAVDSLVRAVREVVVDIPLSAAVVPEPERARIWKGQDWVRWAQRGYVDFVVPMAYSYEPPELRRRMQLVRNLIGREKFLVGLPLYAGRAHYLGYSVSALRELGVLGYSLFSYNVIAEQRFAIQFLNEVFFGGEGRPEEE